MNNAVTEPSPVGKKLGVMQPYLFPYLGYFQLIEAVDRFVLYDDVNFIKQGWINRNNVLISGKAHLFTVPIKGISSFTRIDEVLLDDRTYVSWRAKFLRTLGQAYGKSPHFAATMSLVEQVFDPTETHIGPLAARSINAVVAYLGITTEIVTGSARYQNDSLTGQDRILDICRQEGAVCYVNAPGGRNLYDHGTFRTHGMKLGFIEPQLPAYTQGTNAFVPGLSIIDVLMHNSPQHVRSMLNVRIIS